MSVTLTATKRAKTGKGSARSLRREGNIPAIIYPGVNITLSEKEVTKLYMKGGFMSHPINIDLEGKIYKALPKDVGLNPVTDRIEHADFIHLAEGATVKVKVRVRFLNEDKCIGLKRGGVFNVVKREIEFSCNADNIPGSIDIDILDLDIGKSIHISHINLPENVQPAENGDFTIATIVGRSSDNEGEKQQSAS